MKDRQLFKIEEIGDLKQMLQMSAQKFCSKWWVYQRERFPIFQYFPMVTAFSFCAVSYSSILRGSRVSWQAFLVALITSLSFFMLLRVADEFKDFEEDSKYRPYRPVPRGLIQLKELGIIGIVLLLVQLLVAYLHNLKLIPLLLIVWIYFALMSKEFFLHNWLKSHVMIYICSHMLIMPLIDFYATACDWLTPEGGGHYSTNLIWFLVASFFNGAVIEFGRKIRAKEDEEEGVETYTYLWGNKRSMIMWLMSMALSLFTAIMAAIQIQFVILVVVILSSVFISSIFFGIRFIKAPNTKNAKVFEGISAIWTFSMYLSLGLLPLILL